MKKECNTVSFKNQVIYVGIDIHKNSWQVSIRHCRHQLANFRITDCERDQSATCNYDYCKETPDVNSCCLDAGSQLQGTFA